MMNERMKRIKFVEVDSEFLKKEIYKLRYDVYVSEFGFEKKEDHPSGFEEDIYDPYSVELAAIEQIDENTQEVVGTIRLILHSENGFPIENTTPTQFIGEKPPIEKIAEISRLTINKDYRRRQGDGLFDGCGCRRYDGFFYSIELYGFRLRHCCPRNRDQSSKSRLRIYA